jgi:anti-sigma factor RsiW
MTVCQDETLLQAWVDRELTPAAAHAFRAHLTVCDGCAARVREAEEVLSLIGTACEGDAAEPVPTARLRARIEESLAAHPPAVRGGYYPLFSQWGLAAAAVLIVGLLGALVVWRDTATVNPSTTERVGEAVSETPFTPGDASGAARQATRLESQTSRHLERAQLLLRSVRNTQAVSASELHYERTLSRELLVRNRLLRRRAEQQQDAGTVDVLAQVEPLLVDIANMPDHAAVGDIAALQSLIRTHGIIAEMRLYASMNGV